MTMGLTGRQQQCLDLIAAAIAAHGIAPTIEELMTAMGLRSKSGISRLVDALVKRGRIRRLAKHARALEIVGPAERRCPHCGHVAGSAACRAAAQNSNPPEPRTRSGVSLGGDQAPPAGRAEGSLSSEALP